MKSTILFICLLLTLVSCGEKGDTGKASFKIILGSGISSLESLGYAGGLLIMGRHVHGGQSFVLSYYEGLELNLQKGPWEFASIGWTQSSAGEKMTGPQKCDYKQVELRDDFQDIGFSMTSANCLTMKSVQGQEFADSQFLKISSASSTTVGFKKLSLKICSSINTTTGSCSHASASSTINSFRVNIPSKANGIPVANAAGLISSCINVSSGYASSTLTLPLGGNDGFLSTNIKLYTGNNCDSGETTHAYLHGLGETQNGLSMLSPVESGTTYVNRKYYYKGASSIVPGSGTVGDVYLVSADISTPITAAEGAYIYYDGSNWSTIPASVMTYENGQFYFYGEVATLYIKE